MISSHASSFAGLPVSRFAPGMALPDDPAGVAWRLEVDESEADSMGFAELVAAFRAEVPADAVRALVIGEWGESYDTALPLKRLVDAAEEWTGLRALFLADLVSEECEISWLTLGDITPLLAAYPALEVLWVRGGNRLKLDAIRHAGLRELRFQSGGLPAEVVRGVGGSDLPGLRRLDLWLGMSEYGGDATVDDLAGVLAGAGLPALRRLAVCNAEIADAVAAAVASAAVVRRLEVLDLSMGTLTDTGAETLLAGQSLTHLDRLDLHHHYVTEDWQRRILAALPGVDVDLSREQQPDDYEGETFYYTAVGE